jgi:predicted MPP superfamily phosphohydrolase
MAKGVHRVDDTWLVVGRGLGMTGMPIRAFSSGQVIELILKRA